MSRQTYFLPIETIHRELDARILVGAALARHGHRVVLGEHGAVTSIARRGRGGVFVGKHIFPSSFPGTSTAAYELLKSRGVALLHLDEEAAFFPGDAAAFSERLEQRLDARILHDNDVICTWGESQADYYRSTGTRASVVVTGHPRFDFYQPRLKPFYEEATREIRSSVGQFVLMNTNTGFANPTMPLSRLLQHFRAEHHSPSEPAVETIWAEDAHAMSRMVQIATAASAFTTVVLRPHPAERVDTYEEIFADNPTVLVRQDGPVTPWILAASGLLHDGCTTAVEAAMASRPIGTVETERRLTGVQIPNRLGQKIVDEESLRQFVDRTVGNGCGPSSASLFQAPEELTALLSNLETPALERFVAVASGVDAEHCDLSLADLSAHELMQRKIRWARGVGRRTVGRSSDRYRYARQKFYGLSNAQAMRRLDWARSVVPGDYRGQQLSDHVMLIEPDQAAGPTAP